MQEVRVTEIAFGKHKGERITRVPVSYLKWMVREETAQCSEAKAELDRRGTKTPTLEVSGHALDRFSQRFLYVWQEQHVDEGGEEGIWTFVNRLAAEALACEEAKLGKDRVNYLGIHWVFAHDGAWPVLKSVM